MAICICSVDEGRPSDGSIYGPNMRPIGLERHTSSFELLLYTRYTFQLLCLVRLRAPIKVLIDGMSTESQLLKLNRTGNLNEMCVTLGNAYLVLCTFPPTALPIRNARDNSGPCKSIFRTESRIKRAFRSSFSESRPK